ncbi:major facilitator superfamily domain-containing protein [Infundibulicybe gibba]|nr:major facilitator superfamily domain-containing protein [Infundibulicybe gibba]
MATMEVPEHPQISQNNHYDGAPHSSPPSPAGPTFSDYHTKESLDVVSLPPMDGGFDAWAYLASAWVIELLVWSYPFSYGVFLNYYTSRVFVDSPSALLPLVGSLSSGIMYLSSVVVLPVISRYPKQKKNAMTVGIILCVTGLVGAAFSTKPWQLVLTQGVTYSVGGTLLYFPAVTHLFEWFSTRKGLVILSAAMRIFTNAIAFALLILPTFPYIKSPLPPAQIVAPKPINTQFLRHATFWVFFIANIIQGLATSLPNLYLPSNVRHRSQTPCQLWITGMHQPGASAPGLIFVGWLSDRFDLRLSIALTAIGSSLSVFLLWGFATKLPLLAIFAFVYGLLAPSWSALWPRFISTVAGDDPHVSSTLLSVFLGGRGIGNVLAAPISSGLLHPWFLTGRSSTAYGVKGYGPLITFTGVILLISTFAVVYRSFEKASLA